jgi:UDP:flavonoid glycosyltransferase YjiC (YdhE family)
MRILFSSISAYGHIFPLVPLALAAQKEGHDVRFATSVDFAPVLESAGLRPVVASQPLNSTMTEVHGVRVAGAGVSAEESLGLMGRIFGSDVPREFVADLAPVLADFKPGLVIHDGFNAGAGLAARLAGIPALCHGFGRAPRGALVTAVEHHLRAYVDEFGLTLPQNYELTLGNRTLDICPPSLQRPDFVAYGNRLELRPVPFSEPSDLPVIVRDSSSGRPLAYVTLGTVSGEPRVLREVITALVSLDMRVLVATGPTVDPAQLAPFPEQVSILRWVPQAQLWPHVDLAVHHGGSGAMLGALAAGVPQVVLPRSADQPTNARALEKAGLARQLSPETATAADVADIASQVLTGAAFRSAAQHVRSEIEMMPAPEDVATRLENLAEEACTT